MNNLAPCPPPAMRPGRESIDARAHDMRPPSATQNDPRDGKGEINLGVLLPGQCRRNLQGAAPPIHQDRPKAVTSHKSIRTRGTKYTYPTDRIDKWEQCVCDMAPGETPWPTPCFPTNYPGRFRVILLIVEVGSPYLDKCEKGEGKEKRGGWSL